MTGLVLELMKTIWYDMLFTCSAQTNETLLFHVRMQTEGATNFFNLLNRLYLMAPIFYYVVAEIWTPVLPLYTFFFGKCAIMRTWYHNYTIHVCVKNFSIACWSGTIHFTFSCRWQHPTYKLETPEHSLFSLWRYTSCTYLWLQGFRTGHMFHVDFSHRAF